MPQKESRKHANAHLISCSNNASPVEMSKPIAAQLKQAEELIKCYDASLQTTVLLQVPVIFSGIVNSAVVTQVLVLLVPIVQLSSRSVEFVWASSTWASTLLVEAGSLLTLSELSLAAFQCLSSVILWTAFSSQLSQGQ